jgi:hypothetical protein
MSEEIRFETITIKGGKLSQDGDGIAVIRGGHQVAVLPEADRLSRALKLPLEEIEYTATNLRTMMRRVVNRDPTPDEEEFWRAVLDFRRGQNQK